MLKFIKSFFGFGKTEEPKSQVETPAAAPTKCGCGRSESGLCVGLHKLTPEQWLANEANPNKQKPAAKKKPAGKKPTGEKKAGGDKKPRGPRKPKAPKAVKSA